MSQLVFGRTLLGARVAGSLLGALTAVVVFDVGRRLAGRWTRAPGRGTVPAARASPRHERDPGRPRRCPGEHDGLPHRALPPARGHRSPTAQRTVPGRGGNGGRLRGQREDARRCRDRARDACRSRGAVRYQKDPVAGRRRGGCPVRVLAALRRARRRAARWPALRAGVPSPARRGRTPTDRRRHPVPARPLVVALVVDAGLPRACPRDGAVDGRRRPRCLAAAPSSAGCHCRVLPGPPASRRVRRLPDRQSATAAPLPPALVRPAVRRRSVRAEPGRNAKPLAASRTAPGSARADGCREHQAGGNPAAVGLQPPATGAGRGGSRQRSRAARGLSADRAALPAGLDSVDEPPRARAGPYENGRPAPAELSPRAP